MAQFLLSVWHIDDYAVDFSGEDAQRRVSQVAAFNDALQADEALVFACGLQPPSTARVFSPDGESEGPFSSAPEQIGGFWVIEADDEVAARKWARMAATACEGHVEIRALQGG